MNREDFATLVRRVHAEHPVWFDLPGDQPPTDEGLDRLQQEMGVKLPDDFTWFLKTFGGGNFAFASVYSADQSSDLYLIQNQSSRGPAEFVAVSDDGTGNLLGFPVIDGKCVDEVEILDHESNELRPAQLGGFLDFLARTAFEPA